MFELGSFVPSNKISEKDRLQNLKKWDDYQNQLLKKHKEVLKERKRNDIEMNLKTDQAWDAFQIKRQKDRPNEVPAIFKHRVDLYMEYV